MKFLNDTAAVTAFCFHLNQTPRENVRGKHIRRRNDEMIEDAMGWPFKLETKRLDVFALAPDNTLSTLLASLVYAIRDVVPPVIAATHRFRNTCFLSRSLAREVTRVLTSEWMGIAVRKCPACPGDVCIQNRHAVCAVCGLVDSDGPLPYIDDDGTGVSEAIEALLVEAITDVHVLLMYTSPGAVKGQPVYVVDVLSFDDPEVSRDMLPSEIELQVFVRQPLAC